MDATLGGAKGDPISALDRLWREMLPVPPDVPGPIDPTAWWPPQIRQALSILGNPGMYRFRAEFLIAPWLATSVYDTTPLRATLAELIDVEKLNNGEIQVAVGAIDIQTAESRFFDNVDGVLSFDHVVASGSLPPGFPMTAIDGRPCWDGGLFTNTPLGPAINLLERCDKGDPSVIRELIVVELFPRLAPIPATMHDVLERMTQLRYTSRLTLDEKLFDRTDALLDLLQKIDEALPDGSAIKRDPTYVKLSEHRKIDRFHVVTANLPDALSKASDFSASSIEARIQAGYADAIAKGLGAPVAERRRATASTR